MIRPCRFFFFFFQRDHKRDEFTHTHSLVTHRGLRVSWLVCLFKHRLWTSKCKGDFMQKRDNRCKKLPVILSLSLSARPPSLPHTLTGGKIALTWRRKPWKREADALWMVRPWKRRHSFSSVALHERLISTALFWTLQVILTWLAPESQRRSHYITLLCQDDCGQGCLNMCKMYKPIPFLSKNGIHPCKCSTVFMTPFSSWVQDFYISHIKAMPLNITCKVSNGPRVLSSALSEIPGTSVEIHSSETTISQVRQ